jgi:hypothetical protein
VRLHIPQTIGRLRFSCALGHWIADCRRALAYSSLGWLLDSSIDKLA